MNKAAPVPPPDEVSDGPELPGISRRGVTARMLGRSMVLWTGGVVITVHANSEHMEQAIDELRTANHEARGERAIGRGESLAPLGAR